MRNTCDLICTCTWAIGARWWTQTCAQWQHQTGSANGACSTCFACMSWEEAIRRGRGGTCAWMCEVAQVSSASRPWLVACHTSPGLPCRCARCYCCLIRCCISCPCQVDIPHAVTSPLPKRRFWHVTRSVQCMCSSISSLFVLFGGCSTTS